MFWLPEFSFWLHVVEPWLVPWADGPGWTVLLGALIGIVCSWIGCFLLLQRLSMLGDALSHTVLLGIVAAFLVTGSLGGTGLVVGAAVCGVLTAALIEGLQCGRNSGRVREDAAMAIVFTSLFALGVVLISTLARNAHLDAQHTLFGDVALALLDETDVGGARVPTVILHLGSVLVSIVSLGALFWKPLLATAFDSEFAAAVGYRPRWVRLGLLVVLSVSIVVSFRAVGAVLSVAMLIVPAATAFLVARRMRTMLLVSAAVSVVASLVGYHLAYWLDSSIGAAMVCVSSGLFAMAVVFAPPRGIVPTSLRRLSRVRTVAAEHVLRDLLRLEGSYAGSTIPVSILRGERHGRRWPVMWSLRRLRSSGHVVRSESPVTGWNLTHRGQAEAQRLERAHRLWESFLVEQVGLPPDHVHSAADQLEHALSPAMLELVDDTLGHPTVDPHGAPIPRSAAVDHPAGYVAVSKLRAGDSGWIVGLAPQTPANVVALNLLLGEQVTVEFHDERQPSWTLVTPAGRRMEFDHAAADSVLIDRRREQRSK